jgi:uncharacterized membrane protein YbhN (UPF0104 family)
MATDSVLSFEGAAETRRPRVRAWAKLLTTFGSLALGVGLIWIAGRGLDLVELQAGLASVRYWPLVFGSLVLMGGPLVLAYEWGIILRGAGERDLPGEGRDGSELGYPKLASMTIITLFWQNIAHFAVGYGYALHRFIQREKVRPAAALGVVTIDQMAEGIAKALYSASLVFYFVAPQQAALLLPLLLPGAVVGYFPLRPILRRGAARLAQRETHSPSGRKRLVSGAMIERYALMWNERAVWACVALALFKKMFKVAAAYGVQLALGLDLPWIAPFTFIAVLDCATMVPLIPGHMGIYEATAAATYTGFGAAAESALLIGVLYHAAFLVAAIVPAAVVTLHQAMAASTAELGQNVDFEPAELEPTPQYENDEDENVEPAEVAA